jgi:hypothetical protein
MRNRARKLVGLLGPLLLVGAFFILFVPASAQSTNPQLRTELLAMRDRDQAARNACPTGSTDDQMKCYVKVGEEIDKPHTQRLNEIVRTYGVPDARLVGADGVEAYYLVLQHSNDPKLKQKSLEGMKKAFKAKVLSPSDYANFTDRLRVNLGKLQIYGANFDLKDGKLVMSPTKDVKNLDKRRKAIGLPPIAEYMKMLEESLQDPGSDQLNFGRADYACFTSFVFLDRRTTHFASLPCVAKVILACSARCITFGVNHNLVSTLKNRRRKPNS